MSEILHESVGTLQYSMCPDYGYKLWLRVDQGISDFYRALIPKYVVVYSQMHPAHITIIRRETPLDLTAWGKYEGEQVDFVYSPVVHSSEFYFWLNCFCKRLEEVRLELGLPVSSRFTRPPDGYTKCFHCTIGNCKPVVQQPPKKKKRARHD
jgi:hypothetical protein